MRNLAERNLTDLNSLKESLNDDLSSKDFSDFPANLQESTHAKV